MKRKTILFGLWLFALLMTRTISNAQTPLNELEKLDITTMETGASMDCYIVYKTTNNSDRWLALDHDETSVNRNTPGTVNERLYVGFTELLEEDRYETKYCWRITKFDDSRYIVEWSVPVSYAATGFQYIDENGLIRADGHSEWMKYYVYQDAETGAYTLGHALGDNNNSGSRKCCWKYNSEANRLDITNGAYHDACAHSCDFYFLKFEHTSTSAEDIAAYQNAYDYAWIVREEMLQYDSNLDRLKAENTSDYGKFDPTKIQILQELGITYTRDSYTTENDRAEVVAATSTLLAVAGMKSTFYIGGDYGAIPTGFYRVKEVGMGKYLTYSEGFKFLPDVNSENQILYLNKTLGNNDTRFALFSYSELKVNKSTALKGSQNQFFNLCQAGEVNGQQTYTFKSGGTSDNPTISSIDEEGIFRYGAIGQYRDLNYRLIFEPVEDLFIQEEMILDGTYDLTFNGVAAHQQVIVIESKVSLNGQTYEITRFGDRYAIGQNDATGYLISESLLVEVQDNKIDALPRPGFRLTPVVDGQEVIVSGLTDFADGDLTGKNVKVTGTVDFYNLETAGSEHIEIMDQKPFFAYEKANLTTTISYNRSFNTQASGEYSTAADPRWEAICLPFDVENVVGNCPVVYEGETNAWPGGERELDATKDYWLYELTSTGFVRTSQIEANKPYIIAFPYSWVEEDINRSYAPQLNVQGNVIFSGNSVAATHEIQNDNVEFCMVSNFKQHEPSEKIYVLDASGLYFERELQAASPFRPYAILAASNQSSPSRIYIENDEPTGLQTPTSVAETLAILSVPGGIEVHSQESNLVTIYTISGMILGRVQIEPGIQFIALPVGTFIIEGVKVIVTP